MKVRCLLVLTIAIILVNTCYSQNRIEVLINGSVQNVNQTIPVENPNDRIEIRIYPQNGQKQQYLIDSLKTEGCGIRSFERARLVFLQPKNRQQQQQQSSSRVIEKEVPEITFKQPVFKSNIYSFEMSVKEVTGCRGQNFSLSLISNRGKSQLKLYKSFMNKYKFIYL